MHAWLGLRLRDESPRFLPSCQADSQLLVFASDGLREPMLTKHSSLEKAPHTEVFGNLRRRHGGYATAGIALQKGDNSPSQIANASERNDLALRLESGMNR